MALPLNTTDNPNDATTVARYHMIEQQIRPWDVSDSQVLDALAQVAREEFVPTAYRSMAFIDKEIPLRGSLEEAQRLGQCMLAPRVQARLVQELQLQATDRVLHIGSGSGYTVALIARLAEHVVSLEMQPAIAQMAHENLQRAGVHNADVRVSDGARDPIPDGPFDAILLSGSVAQVPQDLLVHLKEGGRLVAIVGEEPMMRTTVVRRQGSLFETTQPWDTVAPRLQGFTEAPRFKF